MPIWLENQLAAEADKKHLKGDRRKAYIWGTMNKIKKANGGNYVGMEKPKKK